MKVVVDGQLLEYADEGTGPVILLLHGWGTDHKSFQGLSAVLAAHYRVVRLDFPGFGSSPKPTKDWTVGDYATCVGAFIKKLDLSLHAVIGHSFGGRVIIKGIATGAFTAEKVVLMGSAGVKPAASMRKQAFKIVAKTGKAVTSPPGVHKLQGKLRQRLYESAGSTDYLRAGAMQQIFLNTVNEDLLPLVGANTRPTLLLWGSDDSETPLADAQKIKAQLSNATLVVIPHAEHFVYLDQPVVVQRELERFL